MAEPEPEPPAPEPVSSADEVRALFQTLADRPLARGFERGSCRSGVLRIDGVAVARAAVPAERDALIDALQTWQDEPGLPPIPAAIVAGVLWDGRVALPRSAAEPIGQLLSTLHTEALDFEPLRCRKLKAVQDEGPLWNARGDVLALLARVHDGDAPRDAPGPDQIDYERTAGRAALDGAIDRAPDLETAGKAAFGDGDAIHAIHKATIADLCTERTWKTTWMLRAIDTGRIRASLLPLGQLQTGACELLEQGVDPDIVTPRQD